MKIASSGSPSTTTDLTSISGYSQGFFPDWSLVSQPVTATPTETSTPTATATPSLTDFGIVLVGTWTPDEQTAILDGAKKTGKALNDIDVGSSIVEAFRIVLEGMDGSSWRQLKFSRVSLSSDVCITAKTPTASDFSANIQCDGSLEMNEWTAVHEFGHVLVGMTGSEYLDFIEVPLSISSQSGPLQDSNNNFVMGRRGYANLATYGNQIDWQRSDLVTDNGWGSAAQWDQSSYYVYAFNTPPPPTPTLPPLLVPKIGPCGDGAPVLPTPNATPFPFQQNPCTFANWAATSGVGPVTEIEEAAADMFLNWVYTRNGSGFQDTLWRSSTCYYGGCNDTGLSGQARFYWMDAVMGQMSVDFHW